MSELCSASDGLYLYIVNRDITITSSCLLVRGVPDVDCRVFACIASWFLAPNSMPICTSSARSGDKVTFSK